MGSYSSCNGRIQSMLLFCRTPAFRHFAINIHVHEGRLLFIEVIPRHVYIPKFIDSECDQSPPLPAKSGTSFPNCTIEPYNVPFISLRGSHSLNSGSTVPVYYFTCLSAVIFLYFTPVQHTIPRPHGINPPESRYEP